MDMPLGPADRPPGTGTLPRGRDDATEISELFRDHHLELVADEGAAEDAVEAAWRLQRRG